MAAVKMFIVLSMPFVLAETATGIISFRTGLLAIPPLIGIGMAVDVSILVVGFGVAILAVLKAKQSKVETSGEPKSR